MNSRPRILFVTGKLAEPALRRVLAELAPAVGFEPLVAVLPISVAALLTTNWIASHLHISEPVDRVIVPGLCRGDLAPVSERCGAPAERGPIDLRELPEHFGRRPGPPPGYGEFSIEILAEINHAPRCDRTELLNTARQLRTDGADVIDLGCDPGSTWHGLGDAVRCLRDAGFRVSVDSLNVVEIAAATAAGAELVLSVNSTNVDAAIDWGCEVVAVPDVPATLAGFDATIDRLVRDGVKFRLDPIVEPIGFGFAASLGRYLDTRRRFPDAEMMMGVGNVSELTDVDSAGVNVVLLGFCEELRIGSVLTTQVAPWCRGCVGEIDLARRLVHYAAANGVLPKRLEPRLLLLRDPKRTEPNPAELEELRERLTDPNYRLFAAGGLLHLMNGSMYLKHDDPFALFAEALEREPSIDPSHAFYLGYELAKAVTALTLGKNYVQDRALTWGYLTRPEDVAPGAVVMTGQPLYAELFPCPDPWATARTLARLPRMIFFDGAGDFGELGRYSFVAADPVTWHCQRADELSPVWLTDENGYRCEPVPDLPPFQGGWAGLFGYGLNRTLERVPPFRVDEFRVPDLAVGIYDCVVAFDHLQNRPGRCPRGFQKRTKAAGENLHECV